ncbi:MAG: hypothetical protein HQ500_12745 [Flavobacteriales bacterium]|nr:hypothetical protein [Flavobacteriales bacterium]
MKITEENIDRLEGLDHTELTLLSETLQKHPYSSTLAIALTKAYEAKGDVRYETLIQRAALLSNSRRQLHSFLFEEETEVDPHTTVGASETKLVDVPEVESIELISRVVESIELISRVNEDAEGVQRLPLKALEETVQTPETNVQTDDPFELQYLAEALSAGAALDLIDRLDAFEDQDRPLQEAVAESSEAVEDVDAIGAQEPKVDEKEASLGVEAAIDDKEESAAPVVPDKQSFSRWMATLSNDANSSRDIDIVSPSVTASNEASKIRTPRSFKEAASIIDNFIEKEDDIVPKRAEFFKPAKAAKSSLLDREDIVTETLAKVYAQQGNISKAISTYEKLSLLHPEKSSYFAGLIEKLKTD